MAKKTSLGVVVSFKRPQKGTKSHRFLQGVVGAAPKQRSRTLVKNMAADVMKLLSDERSELNFLVNMGN